MLKFRNISFIFLACTLGSTIISVEAAPIDTSTVIITPLPAPKEVIIEPQGYTECKEVPAGWYNDQWHSAYKACKYNTDNVTYKGEGWSSGYWSCTQYTINNGQATCTNWDWIAGGWAPKYQY